MRNIFRIYNQNKLIIWGLIIGLILIRFLLKSLNDYYKNYNDAMIIQEIKNDENNINGKNKEIVKQEITITNSTNIIDKFFYYCNNHQIENAYALLSDECKEIIYPTLEVFNNNYISKVFNTEKTYEKINSFFDIEYDTKVLDIKENALHTRKCK